MSRVRVLVGTRKGAFVLESDGKRQRWVISGPHFVGWEINHLKGSPADPNRLYASQGTGWFGQLIQRSDGGGKTWEPVGNRFVYDGVPGTHLWYDGTPHPWEFARVWHLEPSLTDPDTIYAGVEDAALFRSTDGGQTWQELPGLRNHESAPSWQPGAGGMCLHTSRTPSTSSRSRAIRSTIHPRESCACTAAARAGTSGRRSREASRNATATSTCCATRWPSTRSIRAACISAPPGGRCTRRPMPETAGLPSSEIFRSCCPSKPRHCHDPRRAPHTSAEAG